MAKSYRKIPKRIEARLNAFGQQDIIVACVRRLSAGDVSAFRDWGLYVGGGRVSRVPPKRLGRYSTINVDGLEIVRSDLPKYTKTFIFQAPNWNGSGTHAVYQDRLVYPRDFIAPRQLEVSVEIIKDEPPGVHHVKFAVEQVLRKSAAEFDSDLLFNLNLLMEVAGAADVFRSDTSLEEYAKTIQLSWEILPPGKVDVVLAGMLRGKPPVSPERRKIMEERLAVLARFEPRVYMAGTSGFLRYFGAQFKDDLVAFENIEYGNALYVMFSDWQNLSQRSRVDLLKGPRDGFERIEHRKGWEKELRAILRARGHKV